jgi:hypothetical protein
VIADFQVGMGLDITSTIQCITESLIERRPALALIASDFVYHPADGKLEDIEREDFLSFDEKCMKRVHPLSLYGSRHPGLSRIGQT